MPPASLITHFGIMRHAKTKWNQEKRIQGRYHSPLISEGKQQAREWGMRLKTYSWNRILASDAKRALETASLINDYLKIPLLSDSRLQEQDWGEWTGKTLDIIKKEVSTLLKTQERAGWGFCPPGGEDRYTVLQRSQKALQEAAEKWPGDKILVVTHKGVIKCLIYFLMGRQFLPEEPSVLNSWSLHHIRFVHQRFQIEKINALAIS